MGAVRPLEKKLADIVGLRLERQAAQVRADTQTAKDSVAEQRADVQAAIKADPTLTESLWEADLVEWEQQELQKHYTEVYIGFWELGELLPEVSDAPAEVESTCVHCDHVVNAPCHLPWPDKYVLTECQRECWPGHEVDVVGGPPLPRDLAMRLGEEG